MSKKKTVPSRNKNSEGEDVVHSISIDGLYENWFLDYASYVILERAVPRIEDGLKPVQRRIAHSIKEMDDGRFNKVANVIGSSQEEQRCNHRKKNPARVLEPTWRCVTA